VNLDVPTLANTLPTDLDVLAELESLEVVEIANTKSVGDLRTETRFNANTGALRGIAFRERNKGRKAVYYVGARSKGDRKAEFEFYANAYREARRRTANRSSVGNPVDEGKAPGVGSVGTGFDWTQPEGRAGYVH
jgi:hypothetical protein